MWNYFFWFCQTEFTSIVWKDRTLSKCVEDTGKPMKMDWKRILPSSFIIVSAVVKTVMDNMKSIKIYSLVTWYSTHSFHVGKHVASKMKKIFTLLTRLKYLFEGFTYVWFLEMEIIKLDSLLEENYFISSDTKGKSKYKRAYGK